MRRRTSRAQARRDREWRQFVRDLTEPARQLSPAEDDRMRSFLDAQERIVSSDDAAEGPAERAA